MRFHAFVAVESPWGVEPRGGWAFGRPQHWPILVVLSLVWLTPVSGCSAAAFSASIIQALDGEPGSWEKCSCSGIGMAAREPRATLAPRNRPTQ